MTDIIIAFLVLTVYIIIAFFTLILTATLLYDVNIQ